MPVLIDAEALILRLKIKSVNKIQKIYDPIRKKYVVLTPEEFVRQIFLAYLITELSYPKSLIQVEKEITVNTLKKRFDILVFNKKGSALMLIECKNINIVLNDNVLEQTVTYNLSLKVPYLVITNGVLTSVFKIDFENSTWRTLTEIPNWQALQ